VEGEPQGAEMKNLREYTIADHAVVSCPFDYYSTMRAEEPVHRDPVTGWYFISRYDDAKAVAHDPTAFSSSTDILFRTTYKPAARRVLDEAGVTVVNTFTTSDPPEAFDFHSVGMHLFPPKKVKELAPSIDALAHRLIDAFIDRGEVQVGGEYSRRLVGTIIGGELGLPLADLDQFKHWADCTGELMKIGITEEQEVKSVRKMVELVAYLRPHLERAKEDGMRGKAIHDIATMNKKDGTPFTQNQRCWMTFLAFTGANNTTVNMINTLVLKLATDHSLQEQLRRYPDQIEKFIEEMLRLEGAAQSIVRRTTRDVAIAGTVIPKGSHVLICLGSANRDESKWGAEAGQVQFNRKDARGHMAFGAGPHVCIGMHLARAELRSATTAFLARTKFFRLKDPSNVPEYLPLPFNRGVAELDVIFERS
jgi:cytochrome P450